MTRFLPLRQLSLLAISAVTMVLFFYWEGHTHLGLVDEGFLWYGAQRVMEGDVPILDFMAYDPGRYYWSASYMTLLGDNSIVALRASTTLIGIIGLFLALALLRRGSAKPDYLFTFLALITFAIWIVPSYKIYDITISIALVAALAYALKQPSQKRFFLMGFVVGLAAVFGRNHGLYGVIGSLTALVTMLMLLGLKKMRSFLGEISISRVVFCWAGGVVTGYLPVLVMLIANREFAIAFWNSIKFLFDYQSTNIPLPVPWPWSVELKGVSLWIGIKKILLGVTFLCLPIYIVFGSAFVIWNRKKENVRLSPVMIASFCLALPYAHFAFSRADINHLAQSIFPFLIGIFAFLSTKQSWTRVTFACLLLILSFFVALDYHPGWQAYKSGKWVVMKIGNDELKVNHITADSIRLLTRLEKEYAPNGQSFVATPNWPGAYALLGRKSLMWEIYALFPRSESFQREEIERIKKGHPGFILIEDRPLDGRDDLRFKNTHPLIEEYVKNNFLRLEDASINPRYHVYVRE